MVEFSTMGFHRTIERDWERSSMILRRHLQRIERLVADVAPFPSTAINRKQALVSMVVLTITHGLILFSQYLSLTKIQDLEGHVASISLFAGLDALISILLAGAIFAMFLKKIAAHGAELQRGRRRRLLMIAALAATIWVPSVILDYLIRTERATTGYLPCREFSQMAGSSTAGGFGLTAEGCRQANDRSMDLR